MKYTSGPWETSLGSVRTAKLINGAHQLIANIARRGTEEAEANATLIVAAPDLLEALEALLEDAHILWQEPTTDTRVWAIALKRFKLALESAHAVIARAKGE